MKFTSSANKVQWTVEQGSKFQRTERATRGDSAAKPGQEKEKGDLFIKGCQTYCKPDILDKISNKKLVS
jgi:hypothetical protein